MLPSVFGAARRLIPERLRPHRYLNRLARRRTGKTVIAGPFEGMRYVDRSVGSAYVPKLLGIYERELASAVEQIVAARPQLIVDVGAAEGYYAVGLTRRLPQTRMVAFEATPDGRGAIGEMAAINGVADRISVLGTCEPETLEAALAGVDDAVVIMDVEGYEDVLLDLRTVPALAKATILVELHEFMLPGIGGRIADRLTGTHIVEEIHTADRSRADFPFRTVAVRMLPDRHIERAVSEQRPAAMSWLFAKPVSQAR